MPSYDYDLIILGGGAAGLVSAKLARGLGKKVVIIEKDKLGGDCTWTGCIPSKTLIKSAQVAHHIHTANNFGLKITPENFNTDAVMEYVRKIRLQVYQTHTPNALEIEDIETRFGSPYFIDSHTISLDGKKLSARRIIIATGSYPIIPSIKGIEDIKYYTNETIFELDKLPSSIIILGAGPIGTELGSALNRLGVRTTIIEMNDHILPREDRELTTLLVEHLRSEGIGIHTQLKAEKVEQSGDSITISCYNRDRNQKLFKGEALLIATGRAPNTQGLSLEKIGIKTHKKGIEVNAFLQTNIRHIFACGDVVGPYLFSHMAEYQAVIATRNALLPVKKRIDPTQKIWITFTDPELATAGLSEEDARKLYGDRILIYRHSVKDIDRAKTDNEHVGMAKFICSPKGQLVGATILSPRAGEIIHEVYVAIRNKQKLSDLHAVIHAYPSYSDLVWHASKKAYIDQLERNKFIRVARWIYNRIWP